MSPPPPTSSSVDPILERLTIRRFLLSMACQGIWWAGYLLFPFVLTKSLAAPAGLVTFAVTMETTAMLLALYWGQLLARGGRRRALMWGGLGGRVVLILMLGVSTAGAYVALLAVVYFFAALFYPAQNGILQANLRPERRGWVFGLGASVQHLVAAAVSVAVGWLLDRDPGAYRWVYAVIGLLGYGYPLLLASLPRPAGDTTVDPGRFFAVPRLPLGPVRWGRLVRALVAPFGQAIATYRNDRRFAWFEANFMIYGLAFMMMIPVVPLFFTEELGLSYQEISSARVLIASLGVAVLGPLAGRLMDRLHPVRLCTIAFAVIAFYPLMLAVGSGLMPDSPAAAAYLGFGVFAVGMAGVNLTWNIGSIAFAPAGQGGYYQGIHVFMVGVRGLLGPALGFAVMKLFGYREAFATATVVFLLAALSSALLARRLDR